jgi:hypothetical protein
VNGSFTTHDTAECRRFEKEGSPKDRLAKPFDSVKKPWKNSGGGESDQMAYLTERLLKLKKKHKKFKKHGKKHSLDSFAQTIEEQMEYFYLTYIIKSRQC